MNRTLYEKSLASGFGAVHFMVDASEEQQVRGGHRRVCGSRDFYKKRLCVFHIWSIWSHSLEG